MRCSTDEALLEYVKVALILPPAVTFIPIILKQVITGGLAPPEVPLLLPSVIVSTPAG